MKSAPRGKSTSATEVTSVSSHGLWLWLGDREVFLSYEEFPWFKEVPVGQLFNVKRLTKDHLHWPDLDVDIHVDSIDHPEKYSLVSKAPPTRRMQPARGAARARAVRRRARG
jgi:hypothetical protein